VLCEFGWYRAKEGVEAKKAGKYTERNKKEQAIGLIKKSYGDVCMEKKEVRRR